MKTNKIIIWMVISIILTSCFSENYRIITHVNRDGSCSREVSTRVDSISDLFPYDLSSGWDISQTDTVVNEYLSQKVKKNVKVSKKFTSVEALSTGLRRDNILPVPEESLKKRFRWFYTYYAFTAVYPEITEKGSVPMDKYLNEAERKLYLQGDLSGYRGMSGFELKMELDGIEDRFMKWYIRNLYEECFEIIHYYSNATNMDFRTQLSAIKDTLYSINKEQIESDPGLNSFGVSDVCGLLDKYFSTNAFTTLYAGKTEEINSMLKSRTKVTNDLLNFSIQYELTLPGKVIMTNTDLRNEDLLLWKVDAFRFLADDYILTAESRVANSWAFIGTLLLIFFAGYCLFRSFR